MNVIQIHVNMASVWIRLETMNAHVTQAILAEIVLL